MKVDQSGIRLESVSVMLKRYVDDRAGYNIYIISWSIYTHFPLFKVAYLYLVLKGVVKSNT